MFQKNYSLEHFSGKQEFPQKVATEAWSPVLTTVLTVFCQKSIFLSKIQQKLRSNCEKSYQLFSFPGNKFHMEKWL